MSFLLVSEKSEIKAKKKHFSGSKRTEDLGLVSKGSYEAKYTHSTICNNQNQFWTRKNLIYQEQIQILCCIDLGQRIYMGIYLGTQIGDVSMTPLDYVYDIFRIYPYKKTLESIEKDQFARYYKITENSSSGK